MATEKRLIDVKPLGRKVFYIKCKENEGIFERGVVDWCDIEDAPTVDAVEVVHGHWIDRPCMTGQVYCSECATIEKSTDSNYKSKHCPNCGAKMDGGTV